VQILDDYNADADAYPGMFVYRNLNPLSTSDPRWIEGEPCMVFDINDETLDVGRRYKGTVYEVHEWSVQSFGLDDPPPAVNKSMYVAVNKGFTDFKESSSSSASGPTIITDVHCTGGRLSVTDGILTGYVIVNGKQQPVVLEISPI